MAVKTACGNGFPLNIPSVIPESGGSGGTSDYSDLTNKPKINSVTLSGNKSLSDIGAASASDVSDIRDLIPSDASTTNLLATADDIPGVATTSAPGIVQPDGTTITIADGVISAIGGGGAGSVSVTADGVKTFGQLMNELYALIDKTKITYVATMYRIPAANSADMYHVTHYDANSIQCSFVTIGSDKLNVAQFTLSASSTFISILSSSSDNSIKQSNNTAAAPASGQIFTFYY